MNDTSIMIPVGYVCIPLETYDDLQRRLNSLKSDFYAEVIEKGKEIARLNAVVESRDTSIELLEKEYTDLSKRDKDNAYKLFQANETIMELKRELHTLYDELCATDDIEEVKPHAVAKE